MLVAAKSLLPVQILLFRRPWLCFGSLLLNFVVVAISEVNHQPFDVGRISTVNDDELLAIVTVNILFFDDIG